MPSNIRVYDAVWGPLASLASGCRVFSQVIAPYDAEDARGLLKASIRDPDPVVFLENEILYGESFKVITCLPSRAGLCGGIVSMLYRPTVDGPYKTPTLP
jgi:hypothetical protein